MLTEQVKISTALNYASGTATVNGSTLDMKEYDGMVVVVKLATVAAGATTSIKLQQGSASDLSDASDLAGSSVSIAADDDNEIKYLELRGPRERYVRVVLVKDGSNAVGASAVYLQYRAKELPVSQPTGVEGEAHASPAEGTA